MASRWHRESGQASALGMLAIFAAAAFLITLIMLFATGVAQRSLLPRLRGKARRAIPEQQAPPAVGTEAASTTPESFKVQVSEVFVADSLRALRRQIQTEKAELDRKIAELRALRDEIRSERHRAEAVANERVAQLAKIFSGMKPQGAARIMAMLDDETFTKVLGQLNKKQAAKVLQYIDPARVARLTQDAARVGEPVVASAER